jgi:hypothetical protein
MNDKVKTEHPMMGDRSASKNKTSTNDMFGKLEEMKKEPIASQSVVPEQKSTEVKTEQPKVTSDLKDLIIFGKISEDISIGGYNIAIATLNARQQKRLISELMKLDSGDRIFYIKIYTLAEAIVSINNVPMDQISTDDSIEDIFLRKVDVISNFQSAFIESLFDKYEAINNNSKEYFKTSLGEQIKK